MKIFSEDVRVFFKFAQKYVRKHPEYNTDVDTFIYDTHFDDTFVSEFYDFASKEVKDLKKEEIEKDVDYLEMQIKSEITKIWWDNNAYYEARLLNDNQFKKAYDSISVAQKFMAVH
jgi:hypothetical protein